MKFIYLTIYVWFDTDGPNDSFALGRSFTFCFAKSVTRSKIFSSGNNSSEIFPRRRNPIKVFQ